MRDRRTIGSPVEENDDDRDDASASTHPGASEVCDGEDDDCDARIDEGVTIAFYRDCDGDGVAGASALPTHACTEPPSSSSCTGGWTTRAGLAGDDRLPGARRASLPGQPRRAAGSPRRS